MAQGILVPPGTGGPHVPNSVVGREGGSFLKQSLEVVKMASSLSKHFWGPGFDGLGSRGVLVPQALCSWGAIAGHLVGCRVGPRRPPLPCPRLVFKANLSLQVAADVLF